MKNVIKQIGIITVLLVALLGATPLFGVTYEADVTTLTSVLGEQLVILEGNASLTMPGFTASSERIEVVGADGSIVRFLEPTVFETRDGFTIYATASTYIHAEQALEMLSWTRIVDNEERVSAQSNYAYIYVPTLEVNLIGDVVVYSHNDGLIASADEGETRGNIVTLSGNTEVHYGGTVYRSEYLVLDLKNHNFSLYDNISGNPEKKEGEEDEQVY